MEHIDRILTSKDNMLIVGPGGTGKSYLFRHIKDRSDSRLLVCASTGVAAINIEGFTLHRALGLRLFKGSVDSLVNQMRKKKKLLSKWMSVTTLIIDEVFMLDIGTFIRASEVISIIRDDPRPWGGIRLLLGGDPLQLPPIKTYNEEEEIDDSGGDSKKKRSSYKYLFQHPIWKRLNLQPIVLNTPYRYVSTEFYDTLSDIRFGILSDRVRELIKRCSRKPVKHPTGIIPTVIMSVNDDVDTYNNYKLGKLPGDPISHIAVFTCTYDGRSMPVSDEKKHMILENTRVQEVLSLKVGAQVMLMVNTIHDTLANGSRGVVVGFNDDNIPIVRFMNELELPIPHNTWDMSIPRDEKGYVEWEHYKVRQIPLRLAYAITSHKSQGATIDTAYISFSRVFCPSQIYIMMSRCRDPEYMFLSGWDEKVWEKCLPDKDAIEFYRSLSQSDVTDTL
jgi:ATP-dependent DNA helicase PIF1